MRLDRFLCEMGLGTRSQVKAFIRQGLVTVNGTAAGSGDMKVDELKDQVIFRGDALFYQEFYYYMLNKPQGVVSAVQDNTARTVVELLGDKMRQDIFPVGRLDKDTEGLLILTNDGELAHRLLSPRKHVDKTYLVQTEHPLDREDIQRLKQGVDIGEERITLPARVEELSECRILLTIHEGKYHQVKRMLQAVDNRVLGLKRIAFAGLMLDESLKPGEYRVLTEQEVEQLHEA